MRHATILFATAATALAVVSGAAAQDSATTFGTADVQERGGIAATGQVVFENLMITPEITVEPLITSTAEASLSIVGDASMVSISVPAAVDVTPAGGGEGLTIVTELGGDQAGVVGLSGLVATGEILSVDIGGEIAVKPEDLAPGEYRGLLVVVAQYN